MEYKGFMEYRGLRVSASKEIVTIRSDVWMCAKCKRGMAIWEIIPSYVLNVITKCIKDAVEYWVV